MPKVQSWEVSHSFLGGFRFVLAKGRTPGPGASAASEERGVPLSIVATGANEHDVTRIENVLRSVAVARRPRASSGLCARTKPMTAKRREKS